MRNIPVPWWGRRARYSDAHFQRGASVNDWKIIFAPVSDVLFLSFHLVLFLIYNQTNYVGRLKGALMGPFGIECEFARGSQVHALFINYIRTDMQSRPPLLAQERSKRCSETVARVDWKRENWRSKTKSRREEGKGQGQWTCATCSCPTKRNASWVTSRWHKCSVCEMRSRIFSVACLLKVCNRVLRTPSEIGN